MRRSALLAHSCSPWRAPQLTSPAMRARSFCCANRADSSRVKLLGVSPLLRSRRARIKLAPRSHSPSLGPSYFRARIGQRERVVIPVLVEIGQGVVDESMSRFVCPNGLDHVQESCRVVHAPVILNDSACTSRLADQSSGRTRSSRGCAKKPEPGRELRLTHDGKAWGWKVIPFWDQPPLNVLDTVRAADAASAWIRTRRVSQEKTLTTS